MIFDSRLCLPSLFAAACATSPPADTPSDEGRAVRAVADAFFDVIKTKDADAGARIVIPDATFVAVRTHNGKRITQSTTLGDWLEQLRGSTWQGYEAFDGEPTVLVDGDVAMIWGRYVFDLNGKRSHTGVDVINFVRNDDGWKVAGGVYSVLR